MLHRLVFLTIALAVVGSSGARPDEGKAPWKDPSHGCQEPVQRIASTGSWEGRAPDARRILALPPHRHSVGHRCSLKSWLISRVATWPSSGRDEGHVYAPWPVMASPTISECMSWVPSYVYTDSRLAMCRIE